MAPKIKPQLDSFGSDYLYKRMNGDTNKKRLFCNRINYEKTLPLKKRLIPIEFRITKPRFKPMPYEKPITRSQQKQSSPSNTVNKENQTHSSDNQKPSQASSGKRRRSVHKRKLNQIDSMSLNAASAKKLITSDVNKDGNILYRSNAIKFKYFVLS